MMGPSSKLDDYIIVKKSAIPADICDDIISNIENDSWSKHSWYNNLEDTTHSEDTQELSVLEITNQMQELLNPFMMQSFKEYVDKVKYKDWSELVYQFSTIRFNRYEKGQLMREHHDHIYSLFDGDKKGIPILSIIINFNEGYDGADLVFWDDYVLPLGKGDILMFPSLFLYPHKVTEMKSGVRYSGVSWAW
jgi:hypothetical protein